MASTKKSDIKWSGSFELGAPYLTKKKQIQSYIHLNYIYIDFDRLLKPFFFFILVPGIKKTRSSVGMVAKLLLTFFRAQRERGKVSFEYVA